MESIYGQYRVTPGITEKKLETTIWAMAGVI